MKYFYDVRFWIKTSNENNKWEKRNITVEGCNRSDTLGARKNWRKNMFDQEVKFISAEYIGEK